jgi:hypothetical protein
VEDRWRGASGKRKRRVITETTAAKPRYALACGLARTLNHAELEVRAPASCRAIESPVRQESCRGSCPHLKSRLGAITRLNIAGSGRHFLMNSKLGLSRYAILNLIQIHIRSFVRKCCIECCAGLAAMTVSTLRFEVKILCVLNKRCHGRRASDNSISARALKVYLCHDCDTFIRS